MPKKKVLVVGSDGQLGKEIQDLEKENKNIIFSFTDATSLDITKKKLMSKFFNNNNFDYCINCAAYTDVEKAEADRVKAYQVNVEGVENLAKNCLKYEVKLIHISTDYVFDGNSTTPYKEEDIKNPINYYGKTKLLGERIIQEQLKKYFIVRSSWLYGKYGNNFVKIMIQLSKNKTTIEVVNDQIGVPTNVKDLAEFILYLIGSKNEKYGIIHFSNQGQATWYDFAKEIFEILKSKVQVIPVTSKEYPTSAKRPTYSVLNNGKAIQITNFKFRNWKFALKEYIKTNY